VASDLTVIGGGVVGAAAAHRAASLGASTTLIDAHDPGRATDAGAGIIAPAINVRDREPWHALARAAAAAYPELVGSLDGEVGYDRVGLVVPAVDDDDMPSFDRFRELIIERPGVSDLDPAVAVDRHPLLAPLRAALWCDDAARVDGRLLTAALVGAAEAAGAEIVEGRVPSLAEVASPATVIAGGAWTPQFAEELGVEIPVEPQKGQILHLRVPGGLDTGAWPVVGGLRDQYQVSWPGSRVVVGATRETGSGFDRRVTAGGVRHVLDEALRVAPGLADAELLQVRVGLRPLTPDLLPVIGRVPGRPDVVVVTGHGPSGLTLGPYSGRLAADLALGQAIDVELAPFALDRDWG
jgi:D-amino-acid dehydrogenase